ncbi:MAG TPA: hypothetical protein VF060_26015 [Trebonia sp.]
MPSLREHTRQGLQLGWIPNDPGRRPREFAGPAPAGPASDPEKEAALLAARRHGGGWIRLLGVIGAFALALFGLIGGFSGRGWFWGIAAVWAVGCWLPAAWLGWRWRKAVLILRRDTGERELRHAAEVAEYEQRKAAWDKSEAERAARAPRWLRVTGADDLTRLDVFGGTAAGRANMLTGLGLSLLERHAVIVLDLSRERVCAELAATAAAAGLGVQDYELPRDLRGTPLLSGLTGEELASQIVEVTHADDPSATAAGRAADLLVLNKIGRVLGADVSMARLHEALSFLLAGEGPAEGEASAGCLTAAERDRLAAAFGDGFRREVAGTLIRLAAVVEPLRDLGADAAGRAPARLTCLSLGEGPRDVTADLTAALIVQWATRSIVAGASEAAGFQPAVVLAGADEQDRRHLARLTAACDRYGVPFVRTFSRLTEESARHLDSRNTAFMRLPTRPEALRAAEHIGLERRFVAGQFSLSRRVSRSRTRTSTDSVTHSTGVSEGGSHTRTTGTTEGESSTVTEMPRHTPQVTVNIDNRDMRGGGRDRGDGGEARSRDRDSRSGSRGDGGRDRGRDGDHGSGGAGGSGSGSRGSGGSGGSRGSGSHDSRPQFRSDNSKKHEGIDLIKSRTRFTARHRSESKTKTWEKTEQTSHTQSTSRSVTDGTSIGDEITYDLSYEHRVQPETLMDLPEDQMLAPHIAEGASAGASVGVGAGRMVALVVDPAVIGSDLVAPVSPDEIPAYQAPPPQVTSHVPAALEDMRRP